MGPAPNQGKGLHTAVRPPALLANAGQLRGSNSPCLNFSFLKYKLSGPSLKSQIAPVLISVFLLSILANLFRNLRLVLAGWLGWKPLQGPCSEVLSFEDNNKPSCCLSWTLFPVSQDSLCPNTGVWKPKFSLVFFPRRSVHLYDDWNLSEPP